MKYLSFIFLLASGSVLHAQTNAELKEFIEASFRHFPRVKESEKASEIAELRLQVAESNYLPTVFGTASYNYLNPVGEASFPVSATETRQIQFQPNNNYNFNVSLSQIIYDFGKTKAQVDKAKFALISSRENQQAAKLQVAAQVVNVYYSLIYLRSAITVQDSVIASYQKNKKLTQERLVAGDALKVDLINAENSIAQEENRKLEYIRLYERQRALLRYTTGLDTVPVGENFDFKIMWDHEQFLSTNPELRASENQIEASNADVRAAAANKRPTLSFQGGTGFRNGYQPDIEEIRFNYVAGLALNIPIFSGGRNNTNLSVARKSKELADISRENLVLNLRRNYESLLADRESYEAQLIQSDVQLNAVREALRLTEVRYTRGLATYVDLSFALSNVQRILLQRLELNYKLVQNEADIAVIQGVAFWEY